MSRAKLYLGKSGQLAVMAEFAARGWNVAVPEVDVGDDLFIIRDQDFDASRIQVKTATAKTRRQGYSAQVNLPLSQLRRVVFPELYYVFALRLEARWADFVVIGRTELEDLHVTGGLGSMTPNKENLVLYLSASQNDLVCSGHSLQAYRNNFEHWPIIDHE